MTTNNSKFITHLSTTTHPLRPLLQKSNIFRQTDSCETSFLRLKKEIMSDRVLMPYNPQLETTCMQVLLGSQLSSHTSFRVRSLLLSSFLELTSAEQSYTQLDREALAIVLVVDKFYMYLYGREFILITDNNSLTRIFHQHSKIPAQTSSRLLRYASFLQAFDYKNNHKKAEHRLHADCLSRSTATNAVQQLIKGEIENPDYSLQGCVIFKGSHVYIQDSLQSEMLEELHHTHIGIVRNNLPENNTTGIEQIQAQRNFSELMRTLHSLKIVRPRLLPNSTKVFSTRTSSHQRLSQVAKVQHNNILAEKCEYNWMRYDH